MSPIKHTDTFTPEEFAAIKKDAEWKKTLQRLGLAEPTIEEVRPSDILYLGDQWPFLQIIESTGNKAPYDEPKIIEAKSGWVILDYGDAMATSPGRLLLGGGYQVEGDDDEGGGGGFIPGKGTVVKQAFDSAFEMIELAKTNGWGAIQIVDGHPQMQRAASIQAERSNILIAGYTPNAEAIQKKERIVAATIEQMKSVFGA